MSLAPLEAVRPVAPAAAYIGGKKLLAGRIVRLLAQIEHSAYAEPFVGMGGIFLRRRARPKIEMINDLSGDVANFFRVLQEHHSYFIDMMRWRVASRDEFERLRGQDPERLTDLQRAVRFYVLQRQAFGGKVNGRHFGTRPNRSSRLDPVKYDATLVALHRRLSGVTIERLPFETFITRYDWPGMLFYCDPPYFGCENDYGRGAFERGQFETLAALARGARGKMIISLNDRPEVRAIFAGLTLTPIMTSYSLAAGNSIKPAAELLISNFALPEG